MAGALLPDDAARHSIRYRIDSTLFVEAAAGSGKTTALVSRIVELLRCGASTLDSLAAITFTEAAALELKIRVRKALLALEETSRDPEELDRARAALDQLDEAAISTIHGFCQRLLAEYPIEAGLAPRIEILDEVRQSLAWRDQWSSILDRAGDDPGVARLFTLAALVGVTPAHLESLAKEVGEEWDRCGTEAADPPAVIAAVSSVVERESAVVLKGLGRALGLSSRCVDPDDRLLGRFSTARELYERLAEVAGKTASGPDRVDELLSVLVTPKPPFHVANLGQRAAWTCDVDDVRSGLLEAQAAMDRVVAGVCDAVLPALVATFDVIAREAAAARRLDGKLVFHDLLVLARDLLAGNSSVLDRVRRRYRFVLIDEFQDTDPLQLEIAELIGRGSSGQQAAAAVVGPGGGQPVHGGLAGVADAHTGAADPPLDAGRLFFVGDPQQSIYRFRGADLAAYRVARGRLAESGPLPLTSNFRSVPGIAEFVNECFGTLIGDAYSKLHAIRDPGSATPPVRIVGGPLDPSMRRHHQRVVESEACAAVIELAVRTEGWLVDEAGKTRPARMSDIAILVPRRTGLDELEAALDDRRIGYRVESASLIYRTQEVRDLLALCRSIDDPGDRVALLAALRSPAFGCGDDDLLAYRRQGGSWSGEALAGRGAGAGADEDDPAAGAGEVGPSGAALVAEALRILAGYRSRRFELGPVGILEEAVRDRRLLQLAAGSSRERESWRRVRFLVERARAFVEGGGGGLREFADWVEEQLAEGLRSVESVLPEPDEDVVHILTVHAAKGLEFPITVLAGFGTSDDVPAGVGRKVLRASAVEVHLTNKLETSGFSSLKADEDALEHEEAIRVLYVAATRARDHLVVCGHHVVPKSPGHPGTLGQRLYQAAQAALLRHPGLWAVIETSVESEVAVEQSEPAALAGGVDGGGGEAGEGTATAAGEAGDGTATEAGAAADGTATEAGAAGEGTAAGETLLASRATQAALPGLAPPIQAIRSAPAGRPLQGALFEIAEVAALQASSVVAQRIGRPPATSPEDWHDWQYERQQLLERISRRTSVRATEVAELAGLTGDAQVTERPADDERAATTTRRRGRGGTQVGRAVHATLQSVSLATARQAGPTSELRALAESEARAERIADRAEDVERLALAALSSPAVRRAFASPAPRREVYVATTVDGIVLDGYVDLCVEEGGELVIIDYKTDTIRDRAAVEAAAERYGLQAAAYALALGDATGLPVRRCVLVFLSPPDQPVEYEVPDLAAAVDRVRGVIAGGAGAGAGAA